MSTHFHRRRISTMSTHFHRRRHWIVAIAMIIGFSIEFFLIPLPRLRGGGGEGWVKDMLTSADSYYALAFPLVLWWWFAVFLRRKSLDGRELGIAFLLSEFICRQRCARLRSPLLDSCTRKVRKRGPP